MKKQLLKREFLPGILFCIIFCITAMAFRNPSKVIKHVQNVKYDTVPEKNKIEINIDMQDLEQTIQKSLALAQKSLEEIDWDKITKEVDQSLDKIDFEKINADIDKSIKDIDVVKMKNEIHHSMKELDKAKMRLDIKKEVRDAMKNINTEELKRNLQNIKKIDAEKIKKDMEDLKKELQKFREELQNTTDAINDKEIIAGNYKPSVLFMEI